MGGAVAENCVSRTVRDNAMLFSLTEDTGDFARFNPVGFVAGPAKRRLRIAFGTTSCNGVEPHPDVKAALEASAKLCESLGHTIVPAQNPVDGQAFYEAFAGGVVVAAREARAVGEEQESQPRTTFSSRSRSNWPITP